MIAERTDFDVSKVRFNFDENSQIAIIVRAAEDVPERQLTLEQLGFANLQSFLRYYRNKISNKEI
jgi:hypothetical protein